MAKLVEGYNMLIWEQDDGTVTYTGSFNRSEWEAYIEKSGNAEKVAADADVPDEEPTPADDDTPGPASSDGAEEPAGNASADEWREYAVAQGASEDEVADLSRNDLRDQYSSKEG